MTWDFAHTVESIGKGVDAAGIAVMLVGGLLALALFIQQYQRQPSRRDSAYRALRRNLGRAILLGLEFLVAADIIRTVAIEPTFRSVGVLGGIVLIRTFLSVSLELETTGRWPWENREEQA